MELKPLDFKSYQTIMGLLAEMGSGQEAAKNFGKVDIAGVIENIFPSHIQDIKGIQVKNGDEVRNVDVKDFSSSGAFANICMEIMAKLLEISRLGEDDGKKSEDSDQD